MRFQIPEYVKYCRVEGHIVIVDLRRGRYFGLEAVASTIWEAVARYGTVSSAVEVLTAEFDVGELIATTDAEKMVTSWLAQGLLVPT